MGMLEGETSDYSVRVQCDLLGLNRTSLYYQPAPISERKLAAFNRIDELYTMNPSWGGATLGTILRREGVSISDPTVRKYMREMGLEAVYPKKNLSKRAHGDATFPYLLRGVTPRRRDHVWGTDITYIRMRHGFLYLVAFMDWFSRYVVSWETSDCMEGRFVVEALERALSVAEPEIVNSDQGSQFTAKAYVQRLQAQGIRVSMDGRGRCMDNIFTERLWRSLKYQEVYLKDYANPREAREGIRQYLQCYNEFRPHQGLNGLTPFEVYHGDYTCFDLDKRRGKDSALRSGSLSQ
jgi:putative transposase